MWIYTIISIANPADQFRFKGAGFILPNDPKIFVLTCNGLKQPFILHKKPSRSECHPFFVHNILSATGVKHVKSFFSHDAHIGRYVFVHLFCLLNTSG